MGVTTRNEGESGGVGVQTAHSVRAAGIPPFRGSRPTLTPVRWTSRAIEARWSGARPTRRPRRRRRSPHPAPASLPRLNSRAA